MRIETELELETVVAKIIIGLQFITRVRFFKKMGYWLVLSWSMEYPATCIMMG